MDKNKTAEHLYDILNLYSDFKEDNIIHQHEKIEFNFPEEKKEETKTAADNIETINSGVNQEDVKSGKKKIIETAEKIIKCSDCILHKNSKKVPGIGRIYSEIFVITTPVSDEEENFGFPLVCETGDYFKKWMNAININPNDVFITSLLKCSPKNTKVSREIIESCWKYINIQLEIIKPKIILTLGQLSISSVKRTTYDLKKHHGEMIYYKNFKVIPTYHPSDVLKDKNLKKDVWEDLKKLIKILREPNNNE